MISATTSVDTSTPSAQIDWTCGTSPTGRDSSGEWFLGSNGPDQYWDTEDDVWIVVEDEA